MPDKVRIAIDAMGGDHGASVLLPGAETSLIRHPDIEYLLFGNSEVVEPLLAKMPPDRRARLASAHPLGRIGTVADVTPMALFLLSDQALWITGQAIGVDGGFSAGHLEDI